MQYLSRLRNPIPTSGFTLIELLVVITIIILLATLLVGPLEMAREFAQRAACGTQHKVNFLAIHYYANDNVRSVPQTTMPNGNWQWDLNEIQRLWIIEYGSSRKAIFCPSNTDINRDALYYYGWPNNSDPASQVPPDPANYDPNRQDPLLFGLTGYFWQFQRLNGPMTKPMYNGKQWVGRLAEVVSTGSTELSTDVTLSQNGDFVVVRGGYHLPHRTSHVDRHGKPQGGNILFVDGHVEWRPFEDMVLVQSNPEHWF